MVKINEIKRVLGLQIVSGHNQKQAEELYFTGEKLFVPK